MDYFPDSFATANGVALAAGTLGMMVIPPFAEWLVALYTWRGALFLLGAVTFNICVLGALLRTYKASFHSKTGYRQAPHKDDMDADEATENTDGVPGAIGGKCKALCRTLLDRFDPKLFVTEPRFSLFQVPSFLAGAVFSGWQLFLVPHAVALGYGNQKSSFLSTFAGLGSLLGRLTSGFLTDHRLIKPMDLFSLACLLCGVSCMIDLLAVSSFTALSGLATLTGLAIGYTYPLTFAVTHDLIAEERRMAAFGWQYLSLGAGQIFGGAVSGWTYDMTNNYEVVFLMYGGLSFAVVPFMLAIRFTEWLCPTS
ncbi:monocarboxylate transporter 12-like [Acanthaster planci]|uniref:Monocarboxylate transporter 12-like n=1 Tax=Acanthaster planci TaxID=133434 RepID=A0A8B7ZI63_ACAPL|nr:monocarboxylate transporter 12-like [Acanthaster planci]